MEAKMQALAEVIDHLVRHEVFRIGPVVITTTVVNTWMIMAVLFAVVFLLTRNLSDKSKGAQALLEVVVELFYGLIDTGMGKEGRKYLPIVGSLFIFIAFLNLSWFIPDMVPPTTDLMTTAALGVTALLLVHAMGIRERGIVGYLRHYAEPTPIMLPMNLLEEVVRPFSLAIRLFGNMFGEKMVVTILFILAPLLAPTPVMALGLLMGFIQAYIFTLLTVTYLAGATQGH